ncbi:hypothetical protein C8J57DRAFT_1236599 [Mycena rebaudengoi]|nr:hypothetical protein C8J57DRAFT_1236599 [Mycena rebaudengoi]
MNGLASLPPEAQIVLLAQLPDGSRSTRRRWTRGENRANDNNEGKDVPEHAGALCQIFSGANARGPARGGVVYHNEVRQEPSHPSHARTYGPAYLVVPTRSRRRGAGRSFSANETLARAFESLDSWMMSTTRLKLRFALFWVWGPVQIRWAWRAADCDSGAHRATREQRRSILGVMPTPSMLAKSGGINGGKRKETRLGMAKNQARPRPRAPSGAAVRGLAGRGSTQPQENHGPKIRPAMVLARCSTASTRRAPRELYTTLSVHRAAASAMNDTTAPIARITSARPPSKERRGPCSDTEILTAL